VVATGVRSAKADDVDLAWSMSVTGKQVQLTCTHQRVSWVPSSFVLTRNKGPNLRHVWQADKSHLAETYEVAEPLDVLSVRLDATIPAAMEVLRCAGANDVFWSPTPSDFGGNAYEEMASEQVQNRFPSWS
jgi:hypothetical protein